MRKGELTTTLALISFTVMFFGLFAGQRAVKTIQKPFNNAQEILLPSPTTIPSLTPVPCTINSKVSVIDEIGQPISTNKFMNKDQWGFSNSK